MEEVRSTMEEHMNMMVDMVQKISIELRSGFAPSYDNFIGFFHAIDWKERWLICLLAFHVLLLLTAILSRKHVNLQMCLFLLACRCPAFLLNPDTIKFNAAVTGVYFAENLNQFISVHWQMFATQNYFDPHGLFLSVLWSGPLLVIAILILINTLFSLCHLIVQWKRAELRHRARLSQKKEN
ncbi:hypothetical protein Cgig2_014934 [Carnegiea gigantea]|uniref:Transmembrane protein 18 n=1 Tax=Carnegiea gigantea TaxID=171969 RepID=A0A9Q1JUG2_9CARY|nr:hypothetical protein Cgig2_014934 [Carnegiea gigantea]